MTRRGNGARTHAGHGSRLGGLRCIVTGAARGIGAEIARTFSSEGATLGLLDVAADIEAVAADLGAVAELADLADPDAAQQAIGHLVTALGGVDVLVNNAGILRITPLLEITIDEWDLVLDVNARSVLVTTQVAARAMIAAGHGGRIVNMASMGAKQAGAQQAHYAASKAAVIAVTQAAATELGPHGITVNAICPGFFPSKMTRGTLDTAGKMVMEVTPTRRLGNDEDLKGLVVLLVSEASRHITGQAIAVDGGATII
jgi:NAD(P)-dependent dehydrogenase (short-subunit alcohol dehydrogenase family)